MLRGSGGQVRSRDAPAACSPRCGLFWLCVLDAVLLVVGSLVVAGALDLAVPDLFVYSLFLVVVSMPLATLAGIAYHLRYALDETNVPLLARPGRRRLRGVVR